MLINFFAGSLQYYFVFFASGKCCFRLSGHCSGTVLNATTAKDFFTCGREWASITGLLPRSSVISAVLIFSWFTDGLSGSDVSEDQCTLCLTLCVTGNALGLHDVQWWDGLNCELESSYVEFCQVKSLVRRSYKAVRQKCRKPDQLITVYVTALFGCCWALRRSNCAVTTVTPALFYTAPCFVVPTLLSVYIPIKLLQEFICFEP
jgi:hypothetical protein